MKGSVESLRLDISYVIDDKYSLDAVIVIISLRF